MATLGQLKVATESMHPLSTPDVLKFRTYYHDEHGKFVFLWGDAYRPVGPDVGPCLVIPCPTPTALRTWPYIQDTRGRWYYIPNDPVYPLNGPYWPALDRHDQPAHAAPMEDIAAAAEIEMPVRMVDDAALDVPAPAGHQHLSAAPEPILREAVESIQQRGDADAAPALTEDRDAPPVSVQLDAVASEQDPAGAHISMGHASPTAGSSDHRQTSSERLDSPMNIDNEPEGVSNNVAEQRSSNKRGNATPPKRSTYSRFPMLGFSAAFMSGHPRLLARVRTLERRALRLTIERDCASRQLEAERACRQELRDQVTELESQREKAIELCIAALERESMTFLRRREAGDRGAGI